MAYTLMSLRIIDFVILDILNLHWQRKIILLPVFLPRISTGCITLSYFRLPPKSVIVINSASVGRVQMWKVEYMYGKTNRTHAHTTKFTIFIGFVSHINSII
mgnify:CR=1 FL=1